MKYAGVEGAPVDVDGSRFTVFSQHGEVQVIRTSREIMPNEAEIFAKAAVAIEQVTGCSIRNNSLSGDEVVVDAKIDC